MRKTSSQSLSHQNLKPFHPCPLLPVMMMMMMMILLIIIQSPSLFSTDNSSDPIEDQTPPNLDPHPGPFKEPEVSSHPDISHILGPQSQGPHEAPLDTHTLSLPSLTSGLGVRSPQLVKEQAPVHKGSPARPHPPPLSPGLC